VDHPNALLASTSGHHLSQPVLAPGKPFQRRENEMQPKDKPGKPIDPEELVDESLEETFPASDPISPGVGPGEPIPNPGDKPRTPKKHGDK